MKGISVEGKKPKSLRRLGRAALFLGVAVATAGSIALSAGAANAGVGLEPGTVTLSPASGALSTVPSFSTSAGCPAADGGSAVLRIEFGGAAFSLTQTINNPGTNNLASVPFLVSIATVQADLSAPAGTYEIVVYCFPQASLGGTGVPEMSTYLVIGASTYSTTNTPPAGIATSTALVASPNPATTGNTINLTATVTDSDSTTPAGAVQFEVGGSPIGTPVTVACTGTPAVCTATGTTTIATAGTYNLSAVFNPTSNAYSSSTGNYSETVNPPTSPTSGSEPLAVTVPASGTFTLTVATGTVNLTVNGAAATGALNPVTVSDTRNTFPGWSVSGQESDFTGSASAAGSTISGNQLGWVPTDTSLGTGVTLGGTVAPAAPGLGTTAAVLALAHAPNGSGTSVLGANLTLDIPASATAGPYAGIMTITAVTSLA